MSSQSATARPIIYLGMDVHKESITIAVLPAEAKAPTRLERLPNVLPNLKRWLDRVARDGEVRVLRGERSGVRPPPRTVGVGLSVRGDRAVADPETARRTAQTRQTRRGRSRPPLSGGRAHRRAHPE